MHLPNRQSDLIIDLAAKLRGLSDVLFAHLPPAGESFSVVNSKDLFNDQSQTSLLLITDGQVQYRMNGKIITYFERGDLIGLPRSLNLLEGQYTCESSVTLSPYERDDLVTHANSNPRLQKSWTYYLVCLISFYQQAVAREIRTEFQPTAGFIHFRPGETIIEQGTIADRVYTLLEGSADAFCDDVKVGEVHANEIFGALAVFTRQKRIASVVATTDCTVLAVRKEEFIELIDQQPQICLGLIEEMAAKINQLNNQLLALSTKSH